MTLAALLVVGLGLAVAAWGLRAGEKDSVLAVRTPIAKGHQIDRADLVSTSVAGVAGAIPVVDVGAVVGKTTTVDLVSGQVLTAAMVTDAPVPSTGEAVVGLALDPTRVPGAGLQAGDVVTVIAIPDGQTDGADGSATASLDEPEVLAEQAQVFEVSGETVGGSQLLVTLVVADKDAARVAAYSTQNRVAVIEAAPTEAATSAASESSDGAGADVE